MKECMDSAYSRGYESCKLSPSRLVDPGVDALEEEVLVECVPHSPEAFCRATGYYHHFVTEGQVVEALRWWARGYCKGRRPM